MYGTFQSTYVWRKNICFNKTKTSTIKNVPWISADVQAHIDPPPTPPIKVDLDKLRTTNALRVDIWRNPSQATSETYKINMSTFDDGQYRRIPRVTEKL